MRLPALALEVIGALERVARHRLLERLIRGRAWIGLVAFALIGIVTLQLALLKLNAGVGRALARAAALQRENAALSIENSELGSTDHVQAKAAQLGMEFASSASLRFLSAHPRSDIAHAAATLSAPRGAAGEEAHAASSGSSSAAGSAGSEASASAGGETSASAGGEARSAGETTSAQAAQGSSSAPQPAEAGSERSSSETRAGESAGSHAAPQQEAGSAGTASGGAGAATSAPGSAEATPAGGTRASAQG